MKKFRQFIQEALSDRHKRIIDDWGVGDYSFSDHAFGGPQHTHHTVTIPLDHSIAPDRHIKKHLEDHGYSMEGYSKGFVTDKHNRQVKVGKVLAKTGAEHLIPRFQQDPARAVVHITRHPHGVGGMSSGKNWTSCMTIEGKMDYWHMHLPDDLHHGTHVAYLGFPEDNKFDKPLARIALKPFESDEEDHKIIRPEGKTYGGGTHNFSSTVRNWAEKNFPMKDGNLTYHKAPGIYDDDSVSTIHNANDPELIHHSNPDIRGAAASTAKLEDHHIEHIMDRDKNIPDLVHNENLSGQQIHKIIDHHNFDESFSRALSNHPNFDENHVDKYIKKGGITARVGALSDKATDAHIHDFIRNPSIDDDDHLAFMKHGGVDYLKPDDVSHYVNNSRADVGAKALSSDLANSTHVNDYINKWKDYKSSSAPHNHLSDLLQTNSWRMFSKKNLTGIMDMRSDNFHDHQINALKHPEADASHVSQAISPFNNKNVVKAGIEHDHFNQDHINEILGDHENHYPENIGKALEKTNDVTHLDRFSHVMDYDIQKGITSNKLARPYHFDRNLNHTADATDEHGIHSFKELGVVNNPHLDKTKLMQLMNDSKHHFGDGTSHQAMNYHAALLNHPNADSETWLHALKSPHANKIATGDLFSGENVSKITKDHINAAIHSGNEKAVEKILIPRASDSDAAFNNYRNLSHENLTKIIDHPKLGDFKDIAREHMNFQPGEHMDKYIDHVIKNKDFSRVERIKNLTPTHIDKIITAGGAEKITNNKWSEKNIHDFIHNNNHDDRIKGYVLRNNPGVTSDNLHAAIKYAEKDPYSSLGEVALKSSKANLSHLSAAMKAKNNATRNAIPFHKDFNTSHVDHIIKNFPSFGPRALSHALNSDHANSGHIDKALNHDWAGATGDQKHHIEKLQTAAMESNHVTEDHISHVLDNADSYHENTHEAAIRNPAATEDHIDNAEHLPHLHDAVFEVRHDRGWHDDY